MKNTVDNPRVKKDRISFIIGTLITGYFLITNALIFLKITDIINIKWLYIFLPSIIIVSIIFEIIVFTLIVKLFNHK